MNIHIINCIIDIYIQYIQVYIRANRFIIIKHIGNNNQVFIK